MDDLLRLLTPIPGGRAVDLGCGTGRITRRVHEHLRAGSTLGIDNSETMLATARAGDGVRFECGDLRTVDGTFDVVFSNAALQWLDDQEAVVARLCSVLAPGGQLAFQVPSNFDHASHRVADEVGQRFGLAPQRRDLRALSLATYAEILHAGGLVDLDVSMRIYGNEMAHTADVVDWVQGTTLTVARRELPDDTHAEFLAAYRVRLLDELGDPEGHRPYFYAFPRIVAYGWRP